MATPRAMRLRLGLLVLLTIGLLAALIVTFGSLPNLFKRTTPYTVRFTDAPGLTDGAPVRRSGVKIGSVRAIELDEDRGIVRVAIAIDQPYTIRKSEQPTLTAGILGGDVGIDLVPRDPDEKEPLDRSPFEPGAELVGSRGTSVNALLKGASEVVPTTQQTLNEMRKSVQRIEKFVARAEKTIPLTEETLRVYRDLGNDARKVVPEVQKTNTEFQKTNAELQRLIRQGEEVMPEVQRTSEEVRLLARDSRAALPEVMRTNKQIADSAKSLQDTAKTFQDLAPAVEGTLEEYRGLAADARKMMPVIRDSVEDAGMAARNVARLAERADVMLQSNQPKLEKSLDNLNVVLERAAVLFSDANVKNASRTLDNVARASDKFPEISNNADELTRQGIATLKRLNETLTRVDAALTNADRVLKPLGDRGERIARNADETLQKTNGLIDDVRALLKAIDKADGSFRRFLTDPSLYNTVDATAASVLKMLPRIDRILKDFETFADKLARHPEAIGLGGVVKPGDGLKNPPTPPIGPNGIPSHQSHTPKR